MMDDANLRRGSRVSGTLQALLLASSTSPNVYLNSLASNSTPSFKSTRPLLENAGPGSEVPQRRSRGSVDLARISPAPSTSRPGDIYLPESQDGIPQVQYLGAERLSKNFEDVSAITIDQAMAQAEPLPAFRQRENVELAPDVDRDQAIPQVAPGIHQRNPEIAIAVNHGMPQVEPVAPLEVHSQNFDNGIAKPNLKEWKSWKIKYPWLSILLATTISLITTIAVLNHISKTNNGFDTLPKAPGFLSRDPEVERAIWTQGILYTSFPALIMTVYRTMWESTVASFADRQPYVDLKKAGGRPAKATIMLDYKTEPAMYAWKLAFRNKHYILGFCMLSSVLLAILVVPLVAFLFTTASFVSNIALPVSILTTFDPMLTTKMPDLRLSLNSAAAIRIQDARSPQWTNDEFAFPQFTLSTKVQEGNASIETTGYSAHLDCIYISELDYNRTVLPPGTPGVPARATTVEIAANDRGCEIAGAISVFTIPEFPGVPQLDKPRTYGKAWSTTTCSPDSGWSRFSILTARYINGSSSIHNFSLISCIPSYRMTPGTLVSAIGPSSELSLKTFTPKRSNMTKYRPDALWRFYEMELVTFNCFDKLQTTSGDEFIRHVYKIAEKRFPASPLRPDVIIDAALTLFSTTFAVLANAELFKPAGSSLNETGILSVVESRLVVVSPIAYIIIIILGVVALLNISLFFYVCQKSILLEEPVGLVSAAGVLHNSCVNEIVDNLVKRLEYDGKVSSAVNQQNQVLIDRFCFDEIQKKIICYTGPGTPRRRWWMWGSDWARETINSNTLVTRIKRWWKLGIQCARETMNLNTLMMRFRRA